MKTILPPCPEPVTGPRYWRGLDELADTPEFRQWAEREFPAGASELTDPVNRRHFVKIMSASFLLAGFGLTGCRRPEENILPFSKMPPGYIHGVPQFFATAMPTRTGAVPLVAKSHEGRPTKIEGNSLHPDSNGGTDRFAQASVLSLYDPDRLMRYHQGANATSETAVQDFLRGFSTRTVANGGEGLCFLMERHTSPSRERLQKLIAAKYPKARWFIYEPVDFDIQRESASLAFGKRVRPVYKLDQAKRILSLDCDFLGGEDDLVRSIRDFAKGRKISAPDKAQGEDLINRLYVVETLLTLTGASADHRLRVAPSQVLAIAAAFAAELAKTSGDLSAAMAGLGQSSPADQKWISECAKDLHEHAGNCVVMAGQRQPLAVHLLAHAMNAALGNVGKTVVLLDAPAPQAGTIEDLAKLLNARQVETLVVLGGNPVYSAPADLDWAATQRKAKQVIRLGYYDDETSAVSDWLIPQLHYLESWGDLRALDGTLVPVQPLIAPLFTGMTELELLARIGGFDQTNPHEIVRATFASLTGVSGTGFQPVSSSPSQLKTPEASSGGQARSLSHSGQGGEENWNKFLHDGFQAGTAAQPVNADLDSTAITQALAARKPAAPGSDKLEVVFHRDYCMDDGRWNNNGWLQELPDPITKVVWENVVLLSPATFTKLGLKAVDDESGQSMQPLVEITLNDRKVAGPAWALPGMADGVVGLALGYGRQRSGRVGKGTGYDAYGLRTAAAPHFAPGASVTPTGKLHPVSATQSHWKMEGRPIVREANLDEYLEHPDFADGMKMEAPPSTQPLYPNPLDESSKKSPYAWGMAIDLNSCVGCSSCMTACQSENNIPIVGKTQVGRSREMHWLRIDRYFAGPVEAPQVVMQPMLCQHCEAAPCESVCPVNATSHDDDGLNVMVYNRCVGTRYCSNNCPYKVRRFNFFDYNRRPLDELKGPVYASPMFHATDGRWDVARWWENRDYSGMKPEEEWNLLKLVKNPQVTVRMRGVMEKCTFCVQRIEEAKIAKKVKARDTGDVVVPDGTIKTACQQACPAEAIEFGNLKDPESRVAKLKQQQRNYKVLEFLSTKPRTTYLARVRNPNPKMPDAPKSPYSLEEYEQKSGSPFEHLEGAAHEAEAAAKGGER